MRGQARVLAVDVEGKWCARYLAIDVVRVGRVEYLIKFVSMDLILAALGGFTQCFMKSTNIRKNNKSKILSFYLHFRLQFYYNHMRYLNFVF